MLAQSFSFLPVRLSSRPWELVADHELASYLGAGDRRKRLRETLSQATDGGLKLLPAEIVDHAEPIKALRQRMTAIPMLVTSDGRGGSSDLLGILTAFDLL